MANFTQIVSKEIDITQKKEEQSGNMTHTYLSCCIIDNER